MIDEFELKNFANNLQNDIKIGECDTNAIKVYKKYGGIILEGYANFINKDNAVEATPHYWNLVKSNTPEEHDQIIDIANYLDNSGVVYSNHNGTARSIAYMEGLAAQREHDRKEREKLSATWNNSLFLTF